MKRRHLNHSLFAQFSCFGKINYLSFTFCILLKIYQMRQECSAIVLNQFRCEDIYSSSSLTPDINNHLVLQNMV